MKLPKTIPFGRVSELRSLPDAAFIAVKPGRGAFDECHVKRYSSRLALETFLRNPGGWYALLKNEVHPSMLVHPAFQAASK